MSESLPELGGELEARFGGDASNPLLGELRTQRLIEGSVDFDGVEELREIGSFVETCIAMGGVNDAIPILIGPAGGADANFAGLSKSGLRR